MVPLAHCLWKWWQYQSALQTGLESDHRWTLNTRLSTDRTWIISVSKLWRCRQLMRAVMMQLHDLPVSASCKDAADWLTSAVLVLFVLSNVADAFMFWDASLASVPLLQTSVKQVLYACTIMFVFYVFVLSLYLLFRTQLFTATVSTKFLSGLPLTSAHPLPRSTLCLLLSHYTITTKH